MVSCSKGMEDIAVEYGEANNFFLFFLTQTKPPIFTLRLKHNSNKTFCTEKSPIYLFI